MKNKSFIFIILITVILAIFFIINSTFFKKLLFKIELFFTKPSAIVEINFDKNSFQYVNDLYFSKSTYYNNLSNTEKELYKVFLEAVKNYKESFNIDYNTFESKEIAISSLEKISYAITADHPELIQFSNSSLNIQNNSYTVILGYACSSNDYSSQIEYIKNCLNEILSKTNGKNDYEKALFVYDYLAKNNNYSNSQTYGSVQSAYTAFNPSLDTVCSGYAKSAQIIFQNIGLDSELILGTYANQFHIWNRVKLNGDFYSFDSCVTGLYNNKSSITYRGFNFSESDNFYVAYYNEFLPVCNGTKYLNKEL